MKIPFLIFILCLTLSHGFVEAQEKYIWVFLNTNPDREEIGKLANEGKLLVAGPFNSGGGIFIMNTGDMEKAKSWILTDPAIRANRYRIEMFEWEPRIGGACLASEDAGMNEHMFVRYVPHITKFNVQESPRLFLEHDRYLQKAMNSENVLAEGIFNNNDGGIIVFHNEVDRSVIMEDPTVIEGIFIPEFKTIWIADGSFCEDKQ